MVGSGGGVRDAQPRLAGGEGQQGSEVGEPVSRLVEEGREEVMCNIRMTSLLHHAPGDCHGPHQDNPIG